MLRLFYTLYYHRPEQLWRRFKKRFLDRLVDRHRPAPDVACQVRADQGDLFHELLRHRLAGRRSTIRQDPEAVRQGKLCFLGQVEWLVPPPTSISPSPEQSVSQLTTRVSFNWSQIQSLNVDHLWRFHLHYHEFLFDLTSEDEASDNDSLASNAMTDAWSIVDSWIACFPQADKSNTDDAWHPFCISQAPGLDDALAPLASASEFAGSRSR